MSTKTTGDMKLFKPEITDGVYNVIGDQLPTNFDIIDDTITNMKSGIVQSNPNLLINGDFRIWQRGTFLYAKNADYTADRWQLGGGFQVTSDRRGLKMTKQSGISNYPVQLTQNIEISNHLSEKTMTFSFIVHCTSEQPLKNVIYSINLNTTNSSIVRGEYEITNTPQLISVTFKTPSFLSPSISIMPFSTTTSNVETNQSVYINNVKLEIGDKVTPFSPRPYAEELMLCQRYYEPITRGYRGVGVTLSDGSFIIDYPFLVQKRRSPTQFPLDTIDALRMYPTNTVITPDELKVHMSTLGARFFGVARSFPNSIMSLNFETYADADLW